MPFNIHDFKANGLIYGGARPSQFQVLLTMPPWASAITGVTLERISFLCNAASVPPAQIESVDVMYFGRSVKYNGDRVFPDWTVTVMNDEDFVVRRALEMWSNHINTHVGNDQTDDAYTGIGYKSIAAVTQFGKTGTALAQYSFEGIWPKSVEPMDLAWADVNNIQQFQVTFAYDLWVPEAPDGGSGGAGPGPVGQFTGLE